LITAFALLALLTIGCEKSTESASQANSAKAAPSSGTGATPHVVKPVRKTIHYAIEQPGFDIQAFEVTPLYARIPGYVRKWNVDIGDRVQKEAILATLYVPEREAELEQKAAAIRHAAARIEQAKAAVQTAQAHVERTQSQFERLSRIGKTSGVLDKESIDESRLGYEAAKANLVKANADVNASYAQLKVAEADRDYAQVMLQYAEIRAPYDGVVTQRHLNTGDFVQPAAASGAKGQPLYVVNRIDPVRVFVNVPGADAQWLKDGDPAILRLQGAGGEVLQGKVTRNARSLDPQSRTLRTEIDLPNPQGKLLPGMYVQATIAIHHEYVWTIPASAILTEGDQTFSYRLEQGKAVRTSLQIGLKGEGVVELLMKQTAPTSPSEAGSWTPISGDEEFVANGNDILKNEQPMQPAAAKK